MKHLLKTGALGLVLCGAAQPAQADDMTACELLLVQVVDIEDKTREAQIATYHSAADFILSIQDDTPGHITHIDGVAIQALMCRRNDIIPANSDYAAISTGIPFILSQDFDSSDTDSLTLYWMDDKIEHVYKGYPLSNEADALLNARLEEFSQRGLNDWARQSADTKFNNQTNNETVK